ncbi:hypothetical protein GGF40_001910 [Coemansia sp. RSA 1286]|nr:hypothetical protein GGF39_001753 [Coemansia sp. RSA 1721]KAJ2638061.1 hypothetical protein GGF40_001910 [Coemansia sp. RSA 1286]
MDAWQRQNESQPDHYGAHDIVHYLTRFGVIFFFVMNFARIWLDYLFPSYSLKRSVYRKINRTLAMIMCCLLALNDRQLDKAFLTDNNSPEKAGFTKHYYRHVFIGVMAFQLVAVLACISINTEERFADKDAKAAWKTNHKNKMKAKKAKIFGE